ncbi:hypothetical protein AYR66_13470 [Noviherbaspirillum denitrificans]|uniref:Transglycosylase SLT domain-containing protein n=1 Tax=Noviherbaspirillum denitrificans TaxID=1968433 RepID=A0A254TDW4_9BURK|nr:hypothetical protein AYR66_13470 [Noviherbaspirillum denitrificans]
MKDSLPGKPAPLASALKDSVGPLPGQDKQAPGGDKPKDPVQGVWQEKYQEAQKRANDAKDPALKAHAEAEAKQIKLTLDAMQGKQPGTGQEGGAPGADGAPGETPPGAPGEGGPTSKAIEEFKPMIEKAAEKAGVPADILAGMLWQESRGNIQAGSVNGGNGLTDQGLMQVNPNKFAELQQTYPELQGKNLSDPETNIQAAAYFLKELKDKFGTWELALRGYNSGENGVDVNNPNATPAGTGDKTYIPKVLHFAQMVQNGEDLPA